MHPRKVARSTRIHKSKLANLDLPCLLGFGLPLGHALAIQRLLRGIELHTHYRVSDLRCPPLCARATHTAISVITSQVHYPA